MSGPVNLLLRIGHILYGLYVWMVFLSLALLTIVLLAVTPNEQWRRRLTKATARMVFRLSGIPLHVTGLANIPDSTCVLVANHASYLDGIVLTAVLPPRFSFVIKGEMSKVPLAHYLLHRIGSEYVNRSDANQRASDARRLLQIASSGNSLAFFPEGTFRPKPGLRRFHRGAFVAAAKGAVPVVPVVIRGSRAMLPSKRWLPRPGSLTVTAKPPLKPTATKDAVSNLLQVCRQSILDDLGEPDLV